MNKIAAYEAALINSEFEKRADQLVDRYGTCDGYLPYAYLHAFDGLEKDAGLLTNVGKNISGGIYRLGKALGGTGPSGSRTGIGGKMMDYASGIGGKAGHEGAQKLLGAAGLGTALGASALSTAAVPAAGYMALRKLRNRRGNEN